MVQRLFFNFDIADLTVRRHPNEKFKDIKNSTIENVLTHYSSHQIQSTPILARFTPPPRHRFPVRQIPHTSGILIPENSTQADETVKSGRSASAAGEPLS